MHCVFMIRDEGLRNNFLRLFIKEEIGDLNKRNILGLLPQEMIHDQPLADIPKDLEK